MLADAGRAGDGVTAMLTPPARPSAALFERVVTIRCLALDLNACRPALKPLRRSDELRQRSQ